jgi:thiamine pyrophosphokinase
MRAFIYTGGLIAADGITDFPEEGDLVIAADSGYRTAERLGVKVQTALGDFDSFPRDGVDTDVELLTVPAEKDFTDTQMAAELAVSRGATILFIIGGISGRLDHTLSNLGLLEELYAKGVRATLLDGNNRVRFIRSTSELIPRSHYRYFSLLAADERVKGVTVEGGKYPLKNATLRRANQFAVSNEIEKNCALISVKKGGLFIVESRDPA